MIFVCTRVLDAPTAAMIEPAAAAAAEKPPAEVPQDFPNDVLVYFIV